MHHNIEIKAVCRDLTTIRTCLQTLQAKFIGLDNQIDTYFKVPNGRLKLRTGNIENALIHYKRDNMSGPKLSEVTLYKTLPESSLGAILTIALETLVVVEKQREIYFIDNVKFHLDAVKHLGTFVEIEAIDMDGTKTLNDLQVQCEHYMNLFGIAASDLWDNSYSDLLLREYEK